MYLAVPFVLERAVKSTRSWFVGWQTQVSGLPSAGGHFVPLGPATEVRGWTIRHVNTENRDSTRADMGAAVLIDSWYTKCWNDPMLPWLFKLIQIHSLIKAARHAVTVHMSYIQYCTYSTAYYQLSIIKIKKTPCSPIKINYDSYKLYTLQSLNQSQLLAATGTDLARL